MLGVSQMPGGAGVFGSLSLRENLQLAGWTQRRDPDDVAAAHRSRARDVSRSCAPASTIRAADLSGGQQQMLALGMAFIARPRVLLIDELSLGLAPVIVGQMLPIVERLAADGVAIVMVEQSVNVALTVAAARVLPRARHGSFQRANGRATGTARPVALGLLVQCQRR